MEEVIEYIADYIEHVVRANTTISPDSRIKNWGFVELVMRESRSKKKGVSVQPIPVTINGTGDREQVSLDDDFDFMHWIRWTTPASRVINDQDQWGIRSGDRQGRTLRIVIAHKVELGEDLVNDIAQSLPDSIDNDGFKFIFINQWNIDPDHEKIYKVELGETVYEQHRFDWNIYTIDVAMEYIKCVAFTVPNFSTADCLTDEFGECITP